MAEGNLPAGSCKVGGITTSSLLTGLGTRTAKKMFVFSMLTRSVDVRLGLRALQEFRSLASISPTHVEHGLLPIATVPKMTSEISGVFPRQPAMAPCFFCEKTQFFRLQSDNGPETFVATTRLQLHIRSIDAGLRIAEELLLGLNLRCLGCKPQQVGA